MRADLQPETATEVAMLPYVLRHGTRALPSMRAINRHREELYGTTLGVNVLKLGEQQVLTFSLGLLGDAFLPASEGILEPGLRLLSDLLFDPHLPDGVFRQDAVAQEREKLRKFVEGLKNDKATYAAEACTRAMCAGEPYSVFEYGSLEDVEQVSAASLEARRRALLAGAPLDIYVAGAVDPQRALDLVAELFQPQGRPAELPALRGTTPHPARRDAVRELREPMQVKQGKLCMGFRSEVRVGDPEYWDLFVMNGILGSFPHSKLFKNVREKEALCYDASSNYERFKGLMFISAGVEGENLAKARELCLAQLEAIRAGEIDELELEATRMSYFQAFQGLLDNPTSLINLDYSMSLGGRSGAPDQAIAAIEAVTPDAIQAAAGRVYLDTVYTLEPSEEAA